MDAPRELFRTDKGCSYQCDSAERILLEFGELRVAFRVREFLDFRRSIHQIDLVAKLLDPSDAGDYEWVEAPQQNIRRKLTLCELIQLRDLVDGTRFALNLNSMLHQLPP